MVVVWENSKASLPYNSPSPKKMKNKRAQLKIQQMAFVLIAITIFFVLLGLFFVVIKGASLRKESSEIQEKDAKNLVIRLANAPELACGNAFGTQKSNCVDTDKAMMFNVEKHKQDYSNFWDIAEIEIIKTYERESTREVICTLKDYPNCNTIRIYERELSPGGVKGPFVSNYVSLCRKEQYQGEVYDKCEIGLLSVSYEVKNEFQ